MKYVLSISRSTALAQTAHASMPWQHSTRNSMVIADDVENKDIRQLDTLKHPMIASPHRNSAMVYSIRPYEMGW